MEKTLTREAKTQLASSLRRRYQAASSRAKKQILGEFVAVSGYHPKYAIWELDVSSLPDLEFAVRIITNKALSMDMERIS